MKSKIICIISVLLSMTALAQFTDYDRYRNDRSGRSVGGMMGGGFGRSYETPPSFLPSNWSQIQDKMIADDQKKIDDAITAKAQEEALKQSILDEKMSSMKESTIKFWKQSATNGLPTAQLDLSKYYKSIGNTNLAKYWFLQHQSTTNADYLLDLSRKK